MPSTINADNGVSSGSAGLKSTADSSGVLSLQTNGTTAVTVDTSQNVGIGTSSPTTKLNVSGGLAVQGTVGSFPTSGQGWEITGESATACAMQAYNRTAASWLDAKWYAGTHIWLISGTERARINSSGYLLVGGTSASGNARLVVNNGNNVSGDFGFVTLLGSNCNNTSSYHYIAVTGGADKFYLYGNGNVVNTNGSYGTLSDVKLKENIVDATPKLADVMRLQVRNFNLKTEPTHKQIGFVAQEFEQVFPGMVDESPDRDANGNTLETTTKHIKTSVLVPILVKAIQELKAEVDSLKSQLAAKG